jgi:hypothetical protein
MSLQTNSYNKGYNITLTYIFPENINRVYFFLRNISLLTTIDPSLLSHVTITKGSNTWTEGSEFTSNWVGVSNIKAKCISESNDIHSKRIQWYYSLEIQIEFIKTISLYDITSTSSTLCVLDLQMIAIDQDEYVPPTTTSETYSKLYKNLFIKIDKYMKATPIHLSSFESCVINSNIDYLWEFVTDLNKVTKVSKMIADNFEYNNDRFREGTFIKGLTDNNNKTIFLRVKTVCNECKSTCKVYSFETFGTCKKMVKQEIEIYLRKVNDNACHISFLHLFKDVVPRDLIEKFSKDKLVFLQQLKMECEGKNRV